ncbi:hypothetical protein [Bradyrhizobium barranii]
MSDDRISTLSLIAKIAGRAIQKDREQRREAGVTPAIERTETLLLHLTIIKRLARGALPASELALLPAEENPELVKRLAQEVRQVANELQRKRSVIH